MSEMPRTAICVYKIMRRLFLSLSDSLFILYICSLCAAPKTSAAIKDARAFRVEHMPSSYRSLRAAVAQMREPKKDARRSYYPLRYFPQFQLRYGVSKNVTSGRWACIIVKTHTVCFDLRHACQNLHIHLKLGGKYLAVFSLRVSTIA